MTAIRMLRLCCWIAAALIGVTAARAQDAMPDQPVATHQLVTQVCAACHGIDGNSPHPRYPSLAGQLQPYLEGQLHAFAAQGQQRVSGVMGAIAVNLSADEMSRVATYFSRQPLRPSPGASAIAGAPDSGGARIFFQGLPDKGVDACASCHGVRAEGLSSLFPRLAGQHSDYLAEQLRYFRAGRRTTDSNAMMRKVAENMSDADIDSVSQYLARLR